MVSNLSIEEHNNAVSMIALGLTFCCVVIYGSLILLSTAVMQYYAHYKYKAANAIILASAVREVVSNDGQDVTYYPDIIYTYSVAREQFTNDIYEYHGTSSKNQKHAQDIVDKYQVDKIEKAYYAPEQPNISVLNNSPPDVLALAIVLMLVWLASLFIFLIGTKKLFFSKPEQ